MPRMVWWTAATIAHFALIAFWVRAFGPRQRDEDDLLFHSAVVGLGSLQAVLHIVAFSVGLSLGRGLAALTATHLAIAVAYRVHARRLRRLPESPDAPSPVSGRPERTLAVAGGAVVAALALQWALAASSSLRVTGADAAHYHVPYAVNIALGANPFGLAATPHLYPMGMSVLAAWFILPFRDPLLVDLANLLPFLLAWCAILRIVRDTTGQSGLAFGPWCALAMFSVPLFRHSLLLSADLFYTASFLATNALLLRACARLRLERSDAVSLGFAVGMLVSTKVTGLFSAVALAAVYGAVILGRTLAGGKRFNRAGVSIPVVCGAIAVAVASGGVWLVRNWWNYGSPIAPSGLDLFGFEIFPGDKYGAANYYLSVVGDVRGIANYDLASRFWHWVGVWLGAWFPVSGLLIGVPVTAACLAWSRRRSISDSLRARLIFAASSAVIVAAHLALLSGVPWSSLEWTDGFSLRYALPCAAIYWLAAYTSGLPIVLGSRRWRAGAAFALAAVSIAWYTSHQGVPEAPPDEALARLTLGWTLLGLALVAVGHAVARLRRGLWSAAATVALVAAVAAAYASQAERTDARLVRALAADLDRRVSCSTCTGADVSDYREVYLSLLRHERSLGVRCASRRVYTTSRWDFPLDLQSERFENQVFDARGASFTPRLFERDRPGSRACDYVIATRAALDTTNGVPLVNMLNARGRLARVAEAGRFVVFAAR
jgi:hypothetical protein